MNISGEITGSINQRFSKVNNYFHLKNVNEQLSAENLRLNQLLKENYEKPDLNGKLILDTVQIDSLHEIRKYAWLGAKVVGSTVNTQVNFITIHRGALQDVHPNMGVVSPQGIVGRVMNVSDNYASVMTMLHRQYKVVVKFIVAKNGKVKEVTAETSYGFGMEKEVIRIIRRAQTGYQQCKTDMP